jgi:hypothetical protein
VAVRLAVIGSVLTVCLLASPTAQSRGSDPGTDAGVRPQNAAYLTYTEARPIFEALEERLPPAAEWPQWIAAADRATRARVAQGVETSIVNLLLFGTSFTSHPRITARQLNADEINRAVNARLDDFERAIAQPGANERFLYARQALQGGGTIRARLLSMIERATKETETYARRTEQAHALGDPALEFAERSRMYRERGLAPDTSVRINFAVEDALRRIYPAGGARRRVRRVAIVGPGLDVADKQEGFDFYPLQTIQPFALMDSLIRLDLADPDALQMTTFDLSDAVNEHITQAAQRARKGSPYLIHLPLGGEVSWSPALLDYFKGLGGSIGTAVPVTIPPAVAPLKLRAVNVRPSFVERISARDVNVTAQRLTLAEPERFDLIVGTNVFLYYDRLQQGLAMAAAASMLRSGGVLLSNNALVEVPSVGLRSVGYAKTLYSNREEDGDVMIWYQKALE